MWRTGMPKWPRSKPRRPPWQSSGFASCRTSVPEILAILIISATVMQGSPAADPSRESVTKSVTQMQRADYEGNRVALNASMDSWHPWWRTKELPSVCSMGAGLRCSAGQSTVSTNPRLLRIWKMTECKQSLTSTMPLLATMHSWSLKSERAPA
jgi:hypothetical protein